MVYENIRNLREDRDFYQQSIAEYLGCAQGTYSQYERGKRDVPTRVLAMLSALYGISVDYLLGETKSKSVYSRNNTEASHTERLFSLRKEKNLLQKQVADVLNCTQAAYFYYEAGKRGIPTDVLIKLSRFYATSVDYILGLTDVKKPYPPKKEGKFVPKHKKSS